MTVIQLASRARPVAAPAVPQATTATIFQFPSKAKRQEPDDCFTNADWLTDEEKAECRAERAARFAKRDAEKRFGQRLRVVRTIAGLTIDDAAAAVGVKPIMYRKYESGTSTMRTARYLAFSNHPTVKLRGFLPEWLLVDGAPSDKEREIIAYCRDHRIWNDETHSAIAALCRVI